MYIPGPFGNSPLLGRGLGTSLNRYLHAMVRNGHSFQLQLTPDLRNAEMLSRYKTAISFNTADSNTENGFWVISPEIHIIIFPNTTGLTQDNSLGISQQFLRAYLISMLDNIHYNSTNWLAYACIALL